MGGTATVTTPAGKTETVSQWDPNNIGHTFTLRGAPGRGPGLLPQRPAAHERQPAQRLANDQDAGQYYTVTFSFMSGTQGDLRLELRVPLWTMVASFGGVMGAYGFMSGFVHVV